MKKVSIVIPVYNGEKYLEKCLDSVLEQSLRDLEVIIVNDGSNDSTESIIDKYIEKASDIFQKINKENGGQASARNLGIKRATGEYIIFIDSDDYIDKNLLSEMYNKAKKENSDIVVCDYYEVTESQKVLTKAINKFSDDMNVNYILSNPAPWNKLIRTEIIKKNEIYFLEKHIYEDLATMPILGGYAKKITYLEKPLYNYIIRSGSTMRQNKYNKKLESIFVAIEHLEKGMRSRKLYDKYKEEIEYLNIYHLLYSATGRFLQYEEGKEKIKDIIHIIKSNYPNWKNNKYYKKQNLQIKLTSNIFYYQRAIKLYCFLRNKLK